MLCKRNQSYNKEFSTNSHSTTTHLKHSTNFESVENIRSSNVVEFEFELCHISSLLCIYQIFVPCCVISCSSTVPLCVFCAMTGCHTGRLHILFVLPHGSTVSGQSYRRYVLSVIYIPSVLLLHGMAEGTMICIYTLYIFLGIHTLILRTFLCNSVQLIFVIIELKFVLDARHHW